MRADPELEPPPIPWLSRRGGAASARAPRGAWPVWRAGATSCPEPAAAAAAATSVEAPVEEEETAEAAAEVSYWLGCLLAGVSVCVVSPALGQSLADAPPPPPPPPWPELCHWAEPCADNMTMLEESWVADDIPLYHPGWAQSTP